MQITQQPEVNASMYEDVRTAVFADSVRKEEEAAAAAEEKRLEEEAAKAIADRIAALPGLLKDAAKKGDAGQIQELLKEGADVNSVDENGYSALYAATMYQKEQCVVALIQAGATIDCYNNNGVSPLMAAARDGYTAIVKELLAAGADVWQVDEFGRTADSVADEKGFPETSALVKEWAAAHPKA